MENTTAVILSRMMTASRVMDVIANNIANASTPGYEALHLKSSSWVDRMGNVQTPRGADTVAYAQSGGTWRDTQSGPIHRTGNPLDLALSGNGYFTVQTSNGPRMTRDGRFSLSANGHIVDAAGNSLLDASGSPISIPSNSGSLSIASDGTISGNQGIISKIAVVTVNDPQALQSEGGNLFASKTQPTPAANPAIVQGALEGSNVEPITEITHMMQASQNFQMISQFISAEQSRHQNAISKIVSPNG